MKKHERPTLDEILACEVKVWNALVSGDPDADGAMLTDDFLGVYTIGFADKAGHMEDLHDGPTMAEYRLSETRLKRLGKKRALLTYRADYRKPQAEAWEAMFISSLWERRGDQWLNIFSQDTPAA